MADDNSGTETQSPVVDSNGSLMEDSNSRVIINSPPMAVLPLNSSSKLDQEPNPFEQSFSGATAALEKKEEKLETSKPVLPPVASLTSPAVPLIGGGLLPKEVASQFAWESLRSGPLSPSMLQAPADTSDFNDMFNRTGNSIVRDSTLQCNPALLLTDQQLPPSHQSPPHSHPPTHSQVAEPEESMSPDPESPQTASIPADHAPVDDASTRRSGRRKAPAEDSSDTNSSNSKKKQKSTKESTPDDEEKRRNFLERNRIAALKCRQRKKQWLNDLQSKVEYLTNDNERLQAQANELRQQIVDLRTLLMAHKDCPIAQANGFHPSAIQKSMPALMPQPIARSTIYQSNVPPPPQQPQQQQQHAPQSAQRQAQAPAPPAATFSSAAPTSRPMTTTPALISTQAQFPSSMQPRMIAGGSSGVLRF